MVTTVELNEQARESYEDISFRDGNDDAENYDSVAPAIPKGLTDMQIATRDHINFLKRAFYYAQSLSVKARIIRLIANDIFKITNLRDQQVSAILDVVVHGKDVLIIFPTGGGKSTCFQIASLLLNGLTLVVCPLISIMNNHANTLEQLNIPGVACVHSKRKAEDNKSWMRLVSLSDQQRQAQLARDQKRKDNFVRNDPKLLILSPERLVGQVFNSNSKQKESLLQQITLPVQLFVMEEAHTMVSCSLVCITNL